jgi:hypothetical protein
MPLRQASLFVCPVTGQQAMTADGSLPAGWFNINGDCYCPQAEMLIAVRSEAAVASGAPNTPAAQLALLNTPASAAELASVGLADPTSYVWAFGQPPAAPVPAAS